jgi:hypothetical protein
VSKATDSKFAKILSDAFAAGAAAGAGVAPTPMVVSEDKPGGKSWFIADGVCGFGWVHFAGNTAFGKWAKKHGHARGDYPTGLAISSKLMTQSMARNEAWAHAVAKVLTDHGITAYGRSRID